VGAGARMYTRTRTRAPAPPRSRRLRGKSTASVLQHAARARRALAQVAPQSNLRHARAPLTARRSPRAAHRAPLTARRARARCCFARDQPHTLPGARGGARRLRGCALRLALRCPVAPVGPQALGAGPPMRGLRGLVGVGRADQHGVRVRAEICKEKGMGVRDRSRSCARRCGPPPSAAGVRAPTRHRELEPLDRPLRRDRRARMQRAVDEEADRRACVGGKTRLYNSTGRRARGTAWRARCSPLGRCDAVTARACARGEKRMTPSHVQMRSPSRL
jgi:hypothetical protein